MLFHPGDVPAEEEPCSAPDRASSDQRGVPVTLLCSPVPQLPPGQVLPLSLLVQVVTGWSAAGGKCWALIRAGNASRELLEPLLGA